MISKLHDPENVRSRNTRSCNAISKVHDQTNAQTQKRTILKCMISKCSIFKMNDPDNSWFRKRKIKALHDPEMYDLEKS